MHAYIREKKNSCIKCIYLHHRNIVIFGKIDILSISAFFDNTLSYLKRIMIYFQKSILSPAKIML